MNTVYQVNDLVWYADELCVILETEGYLEICQIRMLGVKNNKFPVYKSWMNEHGEETY